MSWTLDQLRSFVAVADTGSLTAAARQLGYTPGALSQQMTALESITGRRLLIRAKSGVELTDPGATLLPLARELLRLEASAARTLASERPTPTPPVRVGVFGSIAVEALGRATRELRERAPHVRMQAVEVDVEHMPESVLERRVDVALGLEYPDAPFPPQRGLVTTRLAAEEFSVVVASSWGGTDVASLPPDMPWIVPPASTTFGRAVRVACGRAAIEPTEEHIVTDTAVALALVDAGLGATLATPLMLKLRPTAAQVLPLPVAAGRDIVAFTRTSSSERAGVELVRRTLMNAFRPASEQPG